MAITTWTYDDKDNQVGEGYLDAAGNCVSLPKKGYAEIRKAYDERGHNTVVAYYDLDGNTVASSDGYARQETGYAAAGTPIEQRYLDTEGNLVNLKKGYARMVQGYDASGVLQVILLVLVLHRAPMCSATRWGAQWGRCRGWSPSGCGGSVLDSAGAWRLLGVVANAHSWRHGHASL